MAVFILVFTFPFFFLFRFLQHIPTERTAHVRALRPHWLAHVSDSFTVSRKYILTARLFLLVGRWK